MPLTPSTIWDTDNTHNTYNTHNTHNADYIAFEDDENNENHIQHNIQRQIQHNVQKQKPALHTHTEIDDVQILTQAFRNLNEAYDQGVENYEELLTQGEIIDHIDKNLGHMDGTLDIAETKIGEMEHPWRIGVKKVNIAKETIDPVPEYKISGETWKYNSILRNWYWASYTITDNVMIYDGLMKMGKFTIDLKRSCVKVIEKGVRFHNGGKSRYDTFEIKEVLPGKKKEKTLHHIFKFEDRDEMQQFVSMMKGIMKFDDIDDEGHQEKSTEKDELLNAIIEKLDSMQDLSNRTGHLVDHQTTQLKQLGNHAGKIDNRLIKDTSRVKRI
jgi:uncharacterized protein YktA (UPF0223 family)